ncbi:hypothetical protein [Parapedomonas caeni]
MLLSSAAGLTAMLALPAFAQEAAKAEGPTSVFAEEIIVTAQKRGKRPGRRYFHHRHFRRPAQGAGLHQRPAGHLAGAGRQHAAAQR